MTASDLELYLLSKMSGVDRVARALATLGATAEEMAAVGAALKRVLEEPGVSALEYGRLLGRPVRVARLGDEAGVFAGSLRREYELRLWPGVPFVVNEHPDGYAWGWGFEQAARPVPADLTAIEPWQWTAKVLTAAATRVIVLEEWTFDLEAVLVLGREADERRFHARFDLGLLQTWRPEP